MKKLKLEIIGLSYSQTQSGAYALVLGEEKGKRRLPLIIGAFEAQAIAIELENMVVAAYFDASKKLQQGRLLQMTAQIMSNEGQHLAVLRQALGTDPVPNAFENGKAST